MRIMYVPALILPIVIACAGKSSRSADPAPSPEEACAAKLDSEWKDGACRTRVSGLTEQEACEQDTTKEWTDGSCQSKAVEPPRYMLASKDLPGIWNYKGCTFTSLDGGSWQTVYWNVGEQGLFTFRTLLFPSEKCEFYKSSVTQQGQFVFDETNQSLKLQFTGCQFKKASSTEEQDCKELTKEQTFELFGESPTRLTMNTLEFNKN